MAQEPSLGELTNIKTEPVLNPGVILDGRDAVRELNQSAQFNAEMKQKKYTQGLENLKGIYQDLGAIQNVPVLQEDRPVLNQKMAAVLNTIAEDPRAALGGAKFNEIQRQLGELRSLSTTSKQDNVYDQFHQKVLESDPSLSTPDNKEKVNQFVNQPLGARKKYLIDTPVKFDPEAAMGKILAQKQVAVPYAETGFDGANNEWMTRTTGTTYGRDAALGLWNQGYDTGTDANNQPIKKWANEQFYKIKNDPEQLEKFGNPKDAREFYQNLGKKMYGSTEDIVGEKTSTRTPNPYSLLGKRQNFALYMEGLKEGNREKLAAVKKNLELGGAPANINFLVRQYAAIAGNKTGDKKKFMVDGKWVEEDVLGLDPSIKKKLAEGSKSTIHVGKSGETETTTISTEPDIVTLTSKGDLRAIHYQRYTEEDKNRHRIPKGKDIGDPVLTTTGLQIEQSDNIIPKRQVMGLLGKDFVEKKLIGSSIDAAADLMGKQENVNSFIDKVNAGKEEDDFTVPGTTKKSETTKTTYSFKGKKYSADQVKEAAKNLGLNIDEYIKKYGLQ